MGMDPVAKDEAFEVIIMLEGPVTIAKHRLFLDEVDKCIDAITQIVNDHPNRPPAKPKLQARVSRAGVRKNA